MQAKASSKTQLSDSPWNGGLEFRTLAESIPALIFVTDSAGLNVYTNAQFQRFTGLCEGELLGDQWLRIIHADDAERAAATWRLKCEEGASYEAKYRFRGADGAYRWHLVRGEPVRDAVGHILRWIGSCTDVHDLITASALIDGGRAVLSGLSAAQGIVVRVRDAHNTLVFDESPRVPDSTATGGLPFVDRGLVRTVANSSEIDISQANDRLVRETLVPTVFEESRTGADSKIRHYRTTRVPFHYPDDSVGITVFAVDVTAEKEAVNKFETLLSDYKNRIDTLPIMAWVADHEGRIVEVNQTWRDHSGISIKTSNEFGEIIASEHMAAFMNQWAFCVETGEILDISTSVSDAITRAKYERRITAIPMASPDGSADRKWYGAIY